MGKTNFLKNHKQRYKKQLGNQHEQVVGLQRWIEEIKNEYYEHD